MHRRQGTRLIAGLGIAILLASFLSGISGGIASGARDDFVTGSGTSYAQIYRVGPTAGHLSLAPVFGLSLADYVNSVGRGEAKLADWAGIGVAERALPDNTPDVKVASTDKDAAKGKSIVIGQSDGATGGGATELFARATDAPLGESRVRLASMEIPGLIDVRHGESYSSAEVLNTKSGKVRQATARTRVGQIELAGGVVKLNGLRWETIQRTGAIRSIIGKFTIEGATIAGTALPVPSTGDFRPLVAPINTALAPIGLKISLPSITKLSGQASVSPLSIDIENSPAGRRFIAPILARLLPVRAPVADAYIKAAKQLHALNKQIPDASVAVLLADLTVGILSGSSQLHLEFGGVNSYTEGEVFTSPFGNFHPFTPPAVGPVQTVFSPGSAGTPPVPPTVLPSDSGTLVAAPGLPGQKTIPGGKGGVAVAVGLIGLGVALGLANLDWYRMRKTRREALLA